MTHSFTITIDGHLVAGADEVDQKTLADALAHVSSLVRRFGPQRAFERVRRGTDSLEPILYRDIADEAGAEHVETIRTH